MLNRLFASSALLVAVPATAYAQQNLTELRRSDIRAEASAIMTAAMQLSNEEATAFWPIYREYELARSQWGDRRIALIKQYAEQYETMTDENAKELADEWFEMQEDRLKLWKSYFDRIRKAVSTTVAARFIQVENQLNMLIDLQIAQELPLVFRTGM